MEHSITSIVSVRLFEERSTELTLVLPEVVVDSLKMHVKALKISSARDI